jgi:hypothetical protein
MQSPVAGGAWNNAVSKMNPTGQPMGMGAPPPQSASAQEQVNIPSIILLATGVLHALLMVLVAVQLAVGVNMPPELATDPNFAQSMEVLSKVGPAFALPWLAVSALLVFAGVRMRALKSWGLVMAASIVAMVPCCTFYCCVPGLAAGIWTLVVINRPEVKSAFS